MKNNPGAHQKKTLFRVKFQEKKDQKPVEVTVEHVSSSEFMGLITLDNFVFNDSTQQVILPTEDEARKRFGKAERLHIPYHSILSIEEFLAQKPDLTKLPFLKGQTLQTEGATSDQE